MSQIMDANLYRAAVSGAEEVFPEDFRPQAEEYFVSRTPLGNNILHIAAEAGHHSFAGKALLLYPFLLFQQNSEGNTPLHVAARFGRIEVVKCLVSSFEQSNSKQLNEAAGTQSLDIASSPPSVHNFVGDVSEGNTSILNDCSSSLLVEKESTSSSSIDDAAKVAEVPKTEQQQQQQRIPLWMVTNNEKSVAIHEALRNKHDEVALYLLNQYPPSACAVNAAGESPLYLAAESGCGGVVEAILTSRAPYSTDGPSGQTPLHALVLQAGQDRFTDWNFNIFAFKYRVANDSFQNLLYQDDDNCCLDDREVSSSAKLLVRRQPDLVSQRDAFGRTALHYAAAKDLSSFVIFLLRKDRRAAYLYDANGFTPLLLAIRRGRMLSAQIILNFCPDSVELRHTKGRHALHLAVQYYTYGFQLHCLVDNPELLRFLNEPDEKGNLPIHLAFKLKDYRAVEMLLATNCVDMFAKNDEGFSASDYYIHAYKYKKLAGKKRFLRNCKSNQDPSLPRIRKAAALREDPLGSDNELIRRRKKTSIEQSEDEPRVKNESAKQQGNNLSVVAALLATITFAAAFTIPGGFDQSSGDAVLGRKAAFQVFVLSDTLAACCSMTVVCLLIENANDHNLYLYMRRVSYSAKILIVAIAGAVVALMSGLYVVIYDEAKWLAVIVCIVGSGFPLACLYLLLRSSFQDVVLPMFRNVYYYILFEAIVPSVLRSNRNVFS